MPCLDSTGRTIELVTVNLASVKQRPPVKRRSPAELTASAPQPDHSGGPPRRGLAWVILAILLVTAGGTGIWLQSRGSRTRPAPTQGYTLVHAYPHDPQAYCQGLIFHEGFLYEGTGSFGESTLRKVELETGNVIQQHDLARDLFGEGITRWQDQLLQLTWKNRQAIVYDLNTFKELRRLSYEGEGWGLTSDGESLIMSDGTDTLRFIHPTTFAVKRRLLVRDGTRRISKLNELEFVDGEIFANIWYEDRIARISPTTGQVLAWIDLSKLYPAAERPHRDAVLNGIAYDAKEKRLFVTGKDWPKLFEIQVPK